MLKFKKRWLWEFYIFFIFFLAITRVVEFFSNDSPVFFYFYFLCSFDKLFYFPYLLNVLQLVLNLLSCFPLFFWVYRQKILTPKAWQVFFIFKVIFDLFGQSYDKIEIRSFLHDDPLVSALIVVQYFLIYTPSYIILFNYAFRQKIYQES